MQRIWSRQTALIALFGLALLGVTLGQQQRLFERTWLRIEQHLSSLKWQEQNLYLPGFQANIQALAIPGFTDVSALTFDASRRTLVSLTNQNPHFIELSLDGELLRSIPFKGFQDPEAIEYIRPGVYVVAEERRRRLVEIHVDDSTEVIDIEDPRNARQFSLSSSDTSNKGFEGLAYDAVHRRLFVAKEKEPVSILEINGFLDEPKGGYFNIDVRSNPERDRGLFVTDLSSLHFDPVSGHLLALSDESKVVLELDSKGAPVSSLTLKSGNNGLDESIPQAEGLTMDDQGNLYIVSEPNLFYRFSKP